ncbi:hypothetical protein ONV78_30925 [Hahella sp. CR1]|uniref:hypothetical protein n=1 Tax=Hahella sp. CR1 TaxID=2992807 RepID=UPI0024430312|nr:hypothetical protein [Hahella sp. CR1]MDG9672185.1 hypothetical protein [Hahella sp. CR1]
MALDPDLNEGLVKNQFLRITQDILLASERWEASVWEFMSSYEVALLRFKATIQSQEELEKKAVDYAFTALALAGGGIMAASVARSIEKYIYDKSLSFVCKNNLETIFNRVYANEKVKSIVGGIVKKGEEALAQKIVGAIKDGVGKYRYSKSPTNNSEMTVLSGMMHYIKYNSSLLSDTLRGATESYLSSIGTNYEKPRLDNYNNTVSEVIGCKYMFPPFTNKTGNKASFSQQMKDRVQEKIELSMYLARLLDCDVLVQRYESSPHAKSTNVRTPIYYSPSQVGYPNTLPDRAQSYNSTGLIEQRIIYSPYGSKVAEQLNKLASKIYNNGTIVEFSNWRGSRPTAESLVKAENLANILGQPYNQHLVESDRPILPRDAKLLGLTERQKKVIKQNSRY